MREKKMRTLTSDEVAALQEADREWRMAWMPPQIDEEGKVRVCVQCHSYLHPLHNKDYDASVGGYCNKLCRRAQEKKLMYEDGMTPQEASDEIDKCEAYKPKVVADTVEV